MAGVFEPEAVPERFSKLCGHKTHFRDKLKLTCLRMVRKSSARSGRKTTTAFTNASAHSSFPLKERMFNAGFTGQLAAHNHKRGHSIGDACTVHVRHQSHGMSLLRQGSHFLQTVYAPQFRCLSERKCVRRDMMAVLQVTCPTLKLLGRIFPSPSAGRVNSLAPPTHSGAPLSSVLICAT